MDTKTVRNVLQIVVAALLLAVGYVIGDLVSKGEFSGLAA